MSFASRNNKAVFEYPFDTSKFEYKKCKDLTENKTYKVYGYFSNVGQYGKQYTVVTDEFFLNLPKYMTESMDKFTDEDIADIKNGRVGFIKKSYTTGNGQQCFTITWVDLT